MIWEILLAVAALVLFVFRQRRSAVWGTATFAGIIGLAFAICQPGFDWGIIGKTVIIGTFVGLVFEGLPMLVKQRPAMRSRMERRRGPNGIDEDTIGFGRDTYRRNPIDGSPLDQTRPAEPDEILTEEMKRLLDRLS